MESKNTANNHKSLESFIRPIIGFAAGAVPAIATKNILLTIGILGICGVLSEVALPQIINRIPGNRLKSLLVLLVAFTLLSGGTYEWYMRYDAYHYVRGQSLIVTYPDKAVKVKLRSSLEKDASYKSLPVGAQVTYLGEASPRKEIRLPARPDGIHFLNAFYRRVKTKSGAVGWIYGSYLR